MLKYINHGLKVTEWAFEHPDLETGIWWSYIERSGLFPLVHSSYRTVSRFVISTFVEIWYLETNTFYMLFGEMTIMLDDVSMLLSIPVVKNIVSSDLLA